MYMYIHTIFVLYCTVHAVIDLLSATFADNLSRFLWYSCPSAITCEVAGYAVSKEIREARKKGTEFGKSLDLI